MKRLVSEILGRQRVTKVPRIEHGTGVIEAMKILQQLDVGALIVMHQGAIAGIFSERDFARAFVSMGADRLSAMRVEHLMTREVVYVAPDFQLDECLAVMTRMKVRHLPVIENGVLLAFLSMRHIMEVLVEDNQFMVNQLLNYITGSGMATELAPPRAGIMGTLNADIQLGART